VGVMRSVDLVVIGENQMVKNTFGRKVFRWAIYKKTEGIPYPGEFWEDCNDEKEAREMLLKMYGDSEDGPTPFHIVRSTLEALKIPRDTTK